MMDIISECVAGLQTNFANGVSRPLAFRLKQLTGLANFLTECENEILSALHQDLGKSAIEAYATEIVLTLAEVNFTLKNLSRWIKPSRVKTTMIALPGKSYIYPEPRGLVLIISPWNYPLQLALLPLVGAIAAGNCAIIKPSEIAPATSKLLADYLPKYIDTQCLQVIEGGVTETTYLLTKQFDYIFYTGNSTIGRVVMEAAAKHLTPVTLELGGKSPCIIDKDCDLDVTAKRIVWSKFTNAGQTCVAPDYLLVHEDIEQKLIARIKHFIQQFYGDNPTQSSDYGRIINKQHHQRLMKLLNGSGDLIIGGNADETLRYIAPTVITNVSVDAPVMKEEIFGPILPIITIKSIDDAIRIINNKPKPLAIYLFSNSTATINLVIERTSSGGVCINHGMLQAAIPTLPFGGVGESGMGNYHGKASFDAFSHRKSVLFKATWFDPSILYPPYTNRLKKLLNWL